jgi:hypothetical protein
VFFFVPPFDSPPRRIAPQRVASAGQNIKICDAAQKPERVSIGPQTERHEI